MTQTLTDLQVEQIKGVIDVLEKAMNHIIKTDGMSDLTLGLEGSQRELAAILNGFVEPNEDAIIQKIMNYDKAEVDAISVKLTAIYNQKTTKLSQMYRDGYEGEPEYEDLEDDVNNLRDALPSTYKLESSNEEDDLNRSKVELVNLYKFAISTSIHDAILQVATTES